MPGTPFGLPAGGFVLESWGMGLLTAFAHFGSCDAAGGSEGELNGDSSGHGRPAAVAGRVWAALLIRLHRAKRGALEPGGLCIVFRGCTGAPVPGAVRLAHSGPPSSTECADATPREPASPVYVNGDDTAVAARWSRRLDRANVGQEVPGCVPLFLRESPQVVVPLGGTRSSHRTVSRRRPSSCRKPHLRQGFRSSLEAHGLQDGCTRCARALLYRSRQHEASRGPRSSQTCGRCRR